MNQTPKKKYDSSVARIASNIASGLVDPTWRLEAADCAIIAQNCVRLARAIVAEVERTEPADAQKGSPS